MLTKAAMYTAIVGALLLINSLLGFLFESVFALLISVLLILYLREYGFKYGLFLCFAFFVVVFLWGGIYVLLYFPLSIIAAYTYTFCLQKGLNAYLSLLILIMVMCLGEYLLTLVILPILGYGGLDSLLEDVNAIFDSFNLGLSSTQRSNLISFVFALSLLLTALFEALIIHMASLIMFKKFNFTGFKKATLSDLKVSSAFSYILIALVFASFALSIYVSDNAIIYYGLMMVGFIAGLILCFEGYIFILLYLNKKNKLRYNLYVLLAVILLVPYSLIALLLIGFLYTSGPLEAYLKRS